MGNSQKSIKIIFAGLDGSGKTSILNSLRKKNYALDDIKPTKGINRLSLKVLDVSFSEWDLGGQDVYRKDYLQKKDPFYNTDLLFYVIDISAPERYAESIDYCKNIIEILKEREEKPTLVVLFHKTDKIWEVLGRKEEQIENLQNSVLNVSRDFDLEFFRTNIFEPQTLMNAYSHGINRISKQTSELSAQLKEMATETFADAILLIESNGLILGEYAKDDTSRDMIMNVYNYLIGAFSYMFKSLVQPERILIDWEDKGHAFLDSTEIEDLVFFFIKYSSNPRKVVQKFVLRSLIQSSKQIRNIIKSYFD